MYIQNSWLNQITIESILKDIAIKNNYVQNELNNCKSFEMLLAKRQAIDEVIDIHKCIKNRIFPFDKLLKNNVNALAFATENL